MFDEYGNWTGGDWWSPWVNQDWNIMDLQHAIAQGIDEGNPLGTDQAQALTQWYVGGQPDDFSMFEGVEGPYSGYVSDDADYSITGEPMSSELMGVGAQANPYAGGLDLSSMPPHVQQNFRNMMQGGTPWGDVSNYLSSMGMDYQGISELSDMAGGGGVGGGMAKELFYPTESTGFAGVGSGIGGSFSEGNTLDSLLQSLQGG